MKELTEFITELQNKLASIQDKLNIVKGVYGYLVAGRSQVLNQDIYNAYKVFHNLPPLMEYISKNSIVINNIFCMLDKQAWTGKRYVDVSIETRDFVNYNLVTKMHNIIKTKLNICLRAQSPEINYRINILFEIPLIEDLQSLKAYHCSLYKNNINTKFNIKEAINNLCNFRVNFYVIKYKNKKPTAFTGLGYGRKFRDLRELQQIYKGFKKWNPAKKDDDGNKVYLEESLDYIKSLGFYIDFNKEHFKYLYKTDLHIKKEEFDKFKKALDLYYKHLQVLLIEIEKLSTNKELVEYIEKLEAVELL